MLRENPFSEGIVDGQWRAMCPGGCRRDDGRSVGLGPLLHIPYDPELFAELNVERFELGKSGKILFNHPQGTHDDRFRAPRSTSIDPAATPANP